MLLNDLNRYAASQNERIKSASFGISSNTPNCNSWQQFNTNLWGKGIGSFQRDEPFKEDDPVPDPTVPKTRLVATIPKDLPDSFDIRGNKILVRSDYIVTEEAALVSIASNSDVFVATGQPGIGKSVFLLLLLMRRLALGLPTALQVDKGYAMLFHEGWVSELTQLQNRLPYSVLRSPSTEPCERIWALIDTSPTLLEPADIFKNSSPFFVVNATSHPGQLDWLETVDCDRFYMEPWSFTEVVLARSFLGAHTKRQLWYLYHEFGGSPRVLAAQANKPETYEKRILSEIQRIDPANLLSIFREPELHRSSRYICTVFPSSNDRRTPVTTVASRRVFRLLWERFIQLRTDEMAQLYHLFRGDPTTSPAAGWIFGLRMHQVLGRKQSIWVSPIRGLLRDSKIVYDDYTASLTARGSTVELNVSKECDLIEGLELRMNHYYRPKPPSFPGIDSLLLARPRGNRQSLVLLIFRITRSTNDHKPNVESLHKINNLKFPSGTRKWYVVVTPSGTHPKIIFPAEEYFGSRTHQRLKPSEVFQVYHFSVLPEFLFRQK